MTLFQIIQILKEIALSQPNIKSATDGSIYDVMNTNPSVKYNVVHFSQTTHQSDEETDYYGLNIFYVSRLEDSLEDNRLQIQSIGKEILDNIIRTFCENWHIDFPIITYTPFTQKFNDLCAGCYCNLRIEVPKEIICADDYTAEVVPGSGIKLQDIGITITQNGLIVITPDAEYEGIGEIRIETNVPQYPAVLQDKEVEYTENGSYTVRPDSNYDGLSSVSVDVLVPDRYDEGYDDGKEDGENEQKAKLAITSFTENNTYTRENGWSAVTVNVPSDYQDGYDDGFGDGEEAQKAKMVATAITENGEYGRPDGYSAITVNVPQGQGYDEGYEDGEAAQKAKMISLSVTANGEYNREDGWSAVTVDVPSDYQDGYDDGASDQKAKMISLTVTANGEYNREDGYSAITVNVPDRYDEGYDDGFAAGASACSGLFISSITLNLDSAITDTATATTTYAPLTSITDIYYTSSDPSIATIDPETGVITAVSNGSVTICTNDRWSGLRDCKTVTVNKTQPGTKASFDVIYYVTSTTEPTAILTNYSLFESATLSNGGANVPLGTGYTFPATGRQSVHYVLKTTAMGAPTTGTGAFQNVATLLEVRNIENLSFVGYKSFESATSLSAITLPSSVTGIATESFYGCSSLSSITLPQSLTFLGSDRPDEFYLSEGYVFAYCTSLSSITIPSGVTLLYNSNFLNCSSLSSITIQGNVTAIGPQCFDGCTSLTGISIPNSVTKIYDRAFARCSSLTNVVLPPNLDAIYWATFSGCTSLTSVTIPSTIVAMGPIAFKGCAKLKSVTIPASVTTLGGYTDPSLGNDGVFAGCSGLTAMTFSGLTPPTPGIDRELGSTAYTFPIIVPCMAVTDYKTVYAPYEHRITCTGQTPATAISINVPTTVTDSATATTTVSPSGATANITYTSSDTSIATVSSNGVITAKGNGTVTICAYDSISGLQDCKTITVRKSGTAIAYTADTSNVDATGETRTITYDATGFNANSFGISISGATGATYTKSGNVFTITFPDNPSTSDRNYVVTLTATTYGGATKTATLNYTQEGKPAIAGSVTVTYDVTSTTIPTEISWSSMSGTVWAGSAAVPYFTSITIGNNTYPIPTESKDGFIVENGKIKYTFPATGRQSVTFNASQESPMITGAPDIYNDPAGGFSFLGSPSAVAVSVNEGVKYIPAMFFSDTCGYCNNNKISSVTIANTVQYIGGEAFLGMHYLTGDIIIPSSVTEMRYELFKFTDECVNTNNEHIPGATFTVKMQSTTPCTISQSAFIIDANNTVMSNKIKVPNSAVNTYKTTGNWIYYTDNIIGY